MRVVIMGAGAVGGYFGSVLSRNNVDVTFIARGAHLNAMNAIGGVPWQLSFSYGRALQETALKEWNGETDNSDAAQKEFLFRAKLNGMARYGDYTEAMEKEVD